MMHGHGESDSAIVAGKPTNRRSDPLRSRWSQGRRPRGMRASKARPGPRAGEPCHRRWRQGTKSREVGLRLGSERYGDLMPAPTSMVDATLA
jgi:hypothetical protein